MAFLSEKLISASAAEETDDDFNLVTGLYKFDGSNSANNNTFLDSSSNNFTVTRRGNASQGTFSPFSAEEGKWSVSFAGGSAGVTSDYLAIPTSDDFAFGTGDFTIEMWLFRTTTGMNFVYEGRKGGNANRILIYFNGSNQLTVSAAGTKTDSETFPTREWVHIALVRSGTTGYLFKNGDQRQTWTIASDYSFLKPDNYLYIATTNYLNNYWFGGFISNLRVLKGTALYTGSSYTVPTAPLTAVTNTKLLIGCSNRFRDKSTSAHTITPVTTPKIKPFSPFAPNAAYNSAVNGGSMSSIGSGDGATIAANTALDLLSDGTFTLDFWFYRTNSLGTYSDYVGMFNGVTSGLLIYQNGTQFQVYTNGSTIFNVTHPNLNEWIHVALTRDGTTLRLFLNGVANGTSTANLGASNFPLSIAADNTGRVGMQGFMSDVRAIKGTAVYTSAFSPPTAPSTAITNTSALFSFTNAAMFDQSGKAIMENYGNVALNTSVKKFGTASVYFDGGSTQQIQIRNTTPFGTGPFTVEFFMKTDTASQAGVAYRRVFKTGVGQVATNIMELFINTGNGTGYGTTTNLTIYTGATSLIGTTAVADDNWHHVAVTRDTSSNLRMFIDGNQSGSTTASYTNDLDTDDFMLGRYRGDGLQGGEYLGYIDELRITLKARYTSNFTAPTKEFASR